MHGRARVLSSSTWPRLAAACLTLAFCGWAAAAFAQTILHTEKSLYRNVTVIDDEGLRCMKFSRNYEGSRQSCMLLRDPDRLVLDYTRMMIAALYVMPNPRRILIVGLGGATLPKALARLLPESDVDVVEVDPAVIRVASRFFGFAPGGRVKVTEDDGRLFVKHALLDGGRYDMVLLDAFDHDYIPEHMLTREFLREVYGVLSQDGVLVANTFSSSRLYEHESTTYEAVFGTFFNLKHNNRVIIASRGGLPTPQQLERNARGFKDRFAAMGADTAWLLGLFSTKRDWSPDARILTDQYSPANLLNAR
jgi:spermidine synthase